MILKNSVSVKKMSNQILLACIIADQIYSLHGYNMVITSVSDSIHGINSLHGTGNAVDIRINGIQVNTIHLICNFITEHLTSEFDIILEKNHIHIEYDHK